MQDLYLYNRVKLSVKDDIATVTLNRPEKHNAIDWLMFKALDDVADKLKKQRQIRAVILTGEGDDFCSGLDIKSVLSSPWTAIKLLFKGWPSQENLAQRVTTNWRKLPIPVIVAIHGRCWGGGLQIALGGDFRIASPDASISIMENKWGLIPDMAGTLALREVMPLDKAMYLAMTAKEITAQEALANNLIFDIAESPLEKANEMATEFCQRSPDSIAAVKKLYHYAWQHNDGDILARETWYQIRVLANKNQRIAVAKTQGKTDKPFAPRRFK